MSTRYEGPQVVGVDLHRRRSVLVRMAPDGERLGTVRIDNDPLTLAAEIAKAGPSPEVVLEATYGWYWAADVLADAGATVHLAHPLGVKAFTYRRVKERRAGRRRPRGPAAHVYASGEGAIGPAGWQGPEEERATCHRSMLAGPRLAAEQLALAAGRPWRGVLHLACSGAHTLTDGVNRPSLRTQLSRLPESHVDAVTISIGGNDAGFAPVVVACARPDIDCTRDPNTQELVRTGLANLPAKLDQLFAEVPRRVEHVFVTEYPDPTVGRWNLRCGHPLVPGFQGFEGLD